MTIRIALILAVLASPAVAKESLWTYDRISKGLFDIGVAEAVRRNCTSISEKKLPAMAFALGLYNYAKSKGYTHSEVQAFLDSDAEQDKLEKRVRAHYKALNLNPDTANSLCDYGKDQIAKSSQVGKLLKVK